MVPESRVNGEPSMTSTPKIVRTVTAPCRSAPRRAACCLESSRCTKHPGHTGRVLVEVLVALPGAHVPPGGTYQATCYPQAEMRLSEVLVRGFTLVELYIDNFFVKTREGATSDGSRMYSMETADSRPARQHVRVVLKNETDQALPARQANFEETL